MPIQKVTKALIEWAARSDTNPVEFARRTGYTYNHAAMLMRGEARFTENTLGRVLLAYGPEVAEPLAVIMRAESSNGNGATR